MAPAELKPIVIPYKPHLYQQKFHADRHKIRLIMSGIRGGKTIAGVNEAIKVALKGWLGRFEAPNRGIIAAPTYPMLRDVVLVEFQKYCPPELYKLNHSEMTATMANGSVILFRSTEDPEVLRGIDAHWFWYDEPAVGKRKAYQILYGRVAQKGGVGWLTTTPKGMNWVYQDILKPIENKDSDYALITFRSIDNPYFPPEEIERLKKVYSPEFFQQELEGKIVRFSGAVYKDFDQRRHVLQTIPVERLKYHILGVDWGFANPCVMLLIGVDGDDNLYVREEWYQSGKTIGEVTAKAKEWQDTHKPDTAYADPSEPAYIREFRSAGINAQPGNNNVAEGINKVNAKIRAGKLFIHESCDNLIRELENYHYVEKDGEYKSEEPVKSEDHAVDALRYAISTVAAGQITPVFQDEKRIQEWNEWVGGF